jgi:hypothetical protein
MILYLQDLIKNIQYSLLLLKETADVTYFSNANPTTSKDEAHLWKRMKNNPNCFAESYEHAERLILENPFNVFFSSELMASWKMKNVPCRIEPTSNVLAKVMKSLCTYFC